MADVFSFESIGTRAIEAEDVYAEIPQIIAELRAENARRGGGDRAFGIMVCGQLGWITMPVCVSLAAEVSP